MDAVITAITGHHVFQSVWALTNAHFTSKICVFSDVKILWVPCILDCDDFFFTSSIVSYHIKIFEWGEAPPPPLKKEEERKKTKGKG